ncbi:hypothetical protein RIF29_35475 [Crotalaria pallida]|uniref:Uncharacterized protein n=1 Tax=Crotalaria pallida TaxID=3830 RepID=A0AAN9HTT8_CROPI
MVSTAKSSLHNLQILNSEKNHLSEPIFSPYLNNNERSFVAKLGEASPRLSPFMSNRKSSPLHHHGEIGVFGAEKYFNEGELNTPRSAAATRYMHQREQQQIAMETMNYKVNYGTSSIRSDSTSNSQSALLQRSSHRNMKNKVHTKSFLAGLGIKCSCSDKNSVDTSDHEGEIGVKKIDTHYGVVHGKSITTTPKKNFNAVGVDANNQSVKMNKPHADLLINKDAYFQKPLNRENSLAFSTVNNNSGLRNKNHLMKVQLQLEQLDEEMPRKSLEVFGSPIFSSRDATKYEDIDLYANSGSNYNNDDAASDASSDLFEIESFREKPNSLRERQASEEVACSPKSCYAPSEASIEWSVVTASAAVMSDSEDQMSEVTIRSPIRVTYSSSNNGKTKVGKREMQKQRPSMLLGCKSHKAVRVAGDAAFITYEKPSSNSTSQVRHKSNIISQVPRFPAERKLGNFGARYEQQQQQHAYASPRASKLRYI